MVPPHHHLHIASHHHSQPPLPRPRKLDHWKVNNEPFELDSRYTVLEYLGSGAYGVVCSAVDTIAISSSAYPPSSSSAPSAVTRYQDRLFPSSASPSFTCCTPCSSTGVISSSTNVAASPSPPLPEIRRDYIAIKKCKNIFESRTMAKRTLREIRLVRCLSHPHVCLLSLARHHSSLLKIISLLSVEPLTSPQQFSSLYTVYELMETDLHSVIKSPQKLSTDHIQVPFPLFPD